MSRFAFLLAVVLFARASFAQTTTADFDPYTFETLRPSWGLQISTGSHRSSSEARRHQGFGLVLDYQALLPERWGVFGIGPALTLYPSKKAPLNGYAFGAEARYQFHYWGHQWLVPTVSYTVDYLISESSGLRRTPAAGLYFLLNVLDIRTAGSFYSNYSVKRTYLIAETRFAKEINYFFGLRIEY